MKLHFSLWRIYIALILSSATGMIYEITATNILFFYFDKSTYSIAAVLSIFLFGLGLGSFVMQRVPAIKRNTWLLWSQLVIAVYSLIVLWNMQLIVADLSGAGLFAVSALLLLIPTFCLGASFALSGLIISDLKSLDAVGLTYAIDLVGAVAGSLCAGFLLLPLFGNSIAIIVAVGCNVLAAVFLMKKKYAIAVVILSLLLLAVYIRVSSASENHDITFKKSSPYGEVSIRRGVLFIDDRDQCDSHYPSSRTELTIVTDSVRALGRDPVEAANIGLGCGLTAEKMADLPGLRLDIIEINPVVVEANRLISDVLQFSNVRLIVKEGLSYMRSTKKSYDLIVMDVEDPAVIHSSNLYSIESFKTIASRLRSDGIFGLWVNQCQGEYEDIVYNTLHKAFPYVSQRNQNVFIASKKPLPANWKYVTKTNITSINTIDHNIMSKVYIRDCKWWNIETNIIQKK